MKKENDVFLFNLHLWGGVDKLILKMRKSIILILTALSLANSGFCQYLPKFRSMSQQEMMAVPMMMAQKAQNTRNYLDQLCDNILQIRTESDDSELDTYLSKAYKYLSNYYNKDLADNQIIAQIKNKESEIRETLAEFEKSKKSKLNNNSTQTVTKQSNSNDSPDNINERYNKAVAKLKNKDFDGAYSDVNQIINSDPNFVMAYNLRGYLSLNYKRNPEIAIKDFTTAIQMSPNNIDFYNSRATCYEYLDKNLEAMLDYNNMLKIDNENLDAYYRRGICKSSLGDRQGAIKDYDFIISYKGERKSEFKNMATVYNNKAFCLVELNKPKDGLPLVNEALKLDESLWYSWDTRAEIYYKIGEFQKCINDMDHAISIEEHDNSYYYRGLAKIKLGKMTDGCSDLSKAGELGLSEAYEAIKKYCN